jgi:hypothetical protein
MVVATIHVRFALTISKFFLIILFLYDANGIVMLMIILNVMISYITW